MRHRLGFAFRRLPRFSVRFPNPFGFLLGLNIFLVRCSAYLRYLILFCNTRHANNTRFIMFLSGSGLVEYPYCKCHLLYSYCIEAIIWLVSISFRGLSSIYPYSRVVYIDKFDDLLNLTSCEYTNGQQGHSSFHILVVTSFFKFSTFPLFVTMFYVMESNRFSWPVVYLLLFQKDVRIYQKPSIINLLRAKSYLVTAMRLQNTWSTVTDVYKH